MIACVLKAVPLNNAMKSHAFYCIYEKIEQFSSHEIRWHIHLINYLQIISRVDTVVTISHFNALWINQ
jgi:hypothetical protein